MANILKGTIVVEAPGLKAAVKNIVADVDKVPAALRSVAESAKKSTDDATDAFSRLNIASAQYSASLLQRVQAFGGGVRANIAPLASMNAQLGITGARMNQFRLATNSAQLALINTGRVLQDLPFGFLGIANNLNPLLESFQRLRTESKLTGTTLTTSLLGALKGGGGIGIALSAFSALMTVSAIGLGSWSRMMGTAKKETEETKTELEELNKTLEKTVAQLSQNVQVRAFGDTAGEIARVRALAAAITNTNKTYDERRRALNALKEVNKNYFGDLTLESQKLGVLSTRVNEYTNALIQAAVVKGFENEISKLAPELSRQENELAKLNKRLQDFQRAAANQQVQAGTAASTVFDQQKKDIEDASAAVVKQAGIVDNLARKYVELRGQITQAVERTLQFRSLGGTSELKVKPKIDKLEFSDIKEIKIRSEGDDEIRKRLLEFFNKTKFNVPINLSGAIENFEFDAAAFDAFVNKFIALEEIANRLGGAFESAFTAIGNGVGVFQALGNAIRQTITKLIAQLAALAAVSGILSLLSGGAAGGFTKIFSGLLNKNFGVRIPGFATGLWSVPKDNFLANLHKNEMVLPARLANNFRESFSPYSINSGKLLPSIGSVNNNISGGGAPVGSISSALSIPSFVRLEAQGDALVGVLSLANQSQKNLF